MICKICNDYVIERDYRYQKFVIGETDVHVCVWNKGQLRKNPKASVDIRVV